MFKVKNKITYFGLEYDHDSVPNAVVITSARPQKIIKWVNSYKPVVMERDGKDVRRERTAVQCPMNFRLRKDEIHNAMKLHKLTSYQDGKFYVVLDHRMGQFEHPDTVKMKQEELRKKVADEKAKSSTEPSAQSGTIEKVSTTPTTTDPKVAGDGQSHQPVVPLQDSTGEHPRAVESVTESGLEVTDRRRGASDTDSEQPSV